METETVVWVVVAIVVALLVLGLLAALMSKRKTEHRKTEAAELRQGAHARTPELDQADVRARAAQLEADQARLNAERAEAQAVEAEQARVAEHATYEDQIRAADRLDPTVDTDSPEYQPDTRYPADGDAAPSHRQGGPAT